MFVIHDEGGSLGDHERSALEEALSAAFSTEARVVCVDFHVVGESEITSLNATHRHKNEATDVLSFPTHENLKTALREPFDEVHLGDIFAYLEGAAIGTSLASLTLHGCLHVLGYDHDKDYVEWMRIETELLHALAERNLVATGIAKGHL